MAGGIICASCLEIRKQQNNISHVWGAAACRDTGGFFIAQNRVLLDKVGLLTKCLFIYSERKKGSKKDAHRRHPMYFIILFKFKAVAERRQWSSAASKPRRKTRVKLCPHFWAANVPSHQTCRLRSASR